MKLKDLRTGSNFIILQDAIRFKDRQVNTYKKLANSNLVLTNATVSIGHMDSDTEVVRIVSEE